MSIIKLIKHDEIQKKIYTIRGVQVMLDKALAVFYDVKTIRLSEQVKRNIEHFPTDFMFQFSALCSMISAAKLQVLGLVNKVNQTCPDQKN